MAHLGVCEEIVWTEATEEITANVGIGEMGQREAAAVESLLAHQGLEQLPLFSRRHFAFLFLLIDELGSWPKRIYYFTGPSSMNAVKHALTNTLNARIHVTYKDLDCLFHAA